MLQVLPHQRKMLPLAVMGSHHVEDDVPIISFWQMVKLCRKPLPSGKCRVFHARRNDEMIQALIAKKLFGAKIKIAFTSTAQRHHSNFTKWLMSQMDSILTTCSAANSYINPKADVVIPHGIDPERYTPAEDREEAWKSLGYPGERGVGIFGRIRESKGTDIFIDAVIPLLEKDKGVTVIICGETLPKFQEFEDRLKAKVSQAGLADRILFIGKQPFDQLPKLFQAMSVVVAASRNEGFGLTVLEAMASGTPVVATEAGAWKDVISNGEHGYCVPCEDAEAMRVALEKVLADDVEVLGSKCREHILEHYTTEREVKAIVEHLQSLVE